MFFLNRGLNKRLIDNHVHIDIIVTFLYHLNHIGLNPFPWTKKSEEDIQKPDESCSPPGLELLPGLKNISSPNPLSTNMFSSPIPSSISPQSCPFPNPLTSYSTPMLQNIFSQNPTVGNLKNFNQTLPPTMKLSTESPEQKPFWSPFNPPHPWSLKEKHDILSNRNEFNPPNGKSPGLDPHPFSKVGYPPPAFMSGNRIPKFDPLEGQLQDMLRYNMERYGGGAFDTIECARRVREILSIHNIGQRLFAKYVLGLSQGTVSELLSKPKCWEKLTEKGRDSYRKMHAWVYDERAVAMLKTLIPRKSELVRAATSTSASLQAQLLAQDRDEMKRKYENMSQIISGAKDHLPYSPTLPIFHEVSCSLYNKINDCTMMSNVR